MARVNVYLPDALADRARAEGLNVSALTRSAIEAELAAGAASEWLARVSALRALPIEHGDVMQAISAARDELAGDGDG